MVNTGRTDYLHMLYENSHEAKKWDTFRNLSLVDAYLTSQLDLILKIEFGQGQYFAILQPSETWGQSKVDAQREILLGDTQGIVIRQFEMIDSESIHHASHHEYATMLVDVIQLGKLPKTVSQPVIVRLYAADEIKSLRRDAICYSLTDQTFKSLPVFGAWETRSLLRSQCTAMMDNQTIDHMIQSAPQVMNDVSGDDGNLNGDWINAKQVFARLARIWIELSEKTIRLRNLESLDSAFQLLDTLLGPFDFVPHE